MNHQKAKTTVFIVEDSLIVLDRLRRMIGELPHVEIVGTAALDFEAIEGIRKLEPDAVILDISMPGGNGINVLEIIKRDPPAPLTMMLTNFAYPKYREACRRLGADYFFDKSIEFEQVLEVLQRLAPSPAGQAVDTSETTDLPANVTSLPTPALNPVAA